jgi:TonB family protein
MKRALGLAVLAVFFFLSYVSAQQEATPDSEAQSQQDLTGDKSDDIQLGTPVRAPNPRLPKSLDHKKGAVVLGATLTSDGTFAELSALAGDRELEEAALDAVHRWQYTPATRDGVPTDADVFIIFTYGDGDVQAKLKPTPPFPTKPRVPLEELRARGELFTVVNPKVMKVPKAIYSPDPDYSETARIAKFQGVCVVSLILGKDGNVQDVWVSRKLGLGLEQKALEAVRRWKFEPAMKDGEPVPVFLNVEVMFRLY